MTSKRKMKKRPRIPISAVISTEEKDTGRVFASRPSNKKPVGVRRKRNPFLGSKVEDESLSSPPSSSPYDSAAELEAELDDINQAKTMSAKKRNHAKRFCGQTQPSMQSSSIQMISNSTY